MRSPLGFYCLALLIVETIIGTVLTASRLEETHLFWGIVLMAILFAFVLMSVTFIITKQPASLVSEKDAYDSARLSHSAIRDLIVDLITEHVKSESLITSRKKDGVSL